MAALGLRRCLHQFAYSEMASAPVKLRLPMREASINARKLNRLGREDFMLGGSILIAGSR